MKEQTTLNHLIIVIISNSGHTFNSRSSNSDPLRTFWSGSAASCNQSITHSVLKTSETCFHCKITQHKKTITFWHISSTDTAHRSYECLMSWSRTRLGTIFDFMLNIFGSTDYCLIRCETTCHNFQTLTRINKIWTTVLTQNLAHTLLRPSKTSLKKTSTEPRATLTML